MGSVFRRWLICKMKLVIILLSCLVGISYQEAYNHYMPFNPILYYYAPAPIRQIVPQGRTPFQVEDGDARFFFNSLTNINIRLAKTSTLTSYVFSTSVATQVVNGGTCLQWRSSPTRPPLEPDAA